MVTNNMLYNISKVFVFLILQLILTTNETNIPPEGIDCSTLRLGQYICPDPDKPNDFIDPRTQQPRDCRKDNKAKGTQFT